MTSKRLTGHQGLILTLTDNTGGTPVPYDVGGDVKSYELTPEDADDSDITFEEAANGLAAAWKLKLTAILSADQDALWTTLWDNAGKTLDFEIGPWGNATPSETKPHFTGQLTVTKKPPVNNEARVSKTGAEFEVELEVTGDVTKVAA